ncbi:MAG: hypothetical protein M1831_004850 [Alyxoria varia]|nr:MAG: hypothetical protein M1831_004850 [Alyxoria varia]
MSQYNYHGSTSNMPSSQTQQLTSIQNIATHPYQLGSPGPSQILPPLQTAPNGQGSYAADAYGNDTSGPRSGDHNTLPHFSGQSHMNVAEPHTSYGPIQPPHTSAPPNAASFGPAQRYSNASHEGAFGTYSQQQNSSNNYNEMFPGFYDRSNGMQNGMQGYQSQPQMQDTQQNQQQQQQQERGQRQGGHSEARVMPVVGSQGRRGILPSATGPAPPIGSGPGTPRTSAPTRNAENKYACIHCNKTYLHLKHLKRHHLRRPSTSNSTASNSQLLPPANDGPTPTATYQSVFSASSNSYHWSGGDPPSMSRGPNNDDSGRTTRSNSAFDRPDSGSGDDRRRLSASMSLAPINGSTNAPPPNGQSSNGGSYSQGSRHAMNGVQETQLNGHSSRDAYGQPMPPGTSAPQNMGISGHADQQQQSHHYMRGGYHPPPVQMQQNDWSNYFQPGGQDTMMFSPHH